MILRGEANALVVLTTMCELLIFRLGMVLESNKLYYVPELGMLDKSLKILFANGINTKISRATNLVKTPCPNGHVGKERVCW